MSLNKQKMVREIGRRTRLKNRDVQTVIETLVEVWTEELVRGGRIEIEHFLVLETQIKRTNNDSKHAVRRINLRLSKGIKKHLHC